MTETVTQEATQDTTLPESWEWARVEQLGNVVTGNTPSTKEQEYYGGSIPLFKPTDLNADYRVLKSETTLTEDGAEKARVLPTKSILVTCIGATIGKTGLSQVEGATNQQINALVPSKGQILSEYLYFAFVSRLLQDQILSNASSTTLPILNKSKFSQLKIPLPPLNEQRRIVEKVEELFTKLDAGVRSLEQARVLLKSYRQSVLKAAVEGELSREWREAHRDELEPASELLERILQERRQQWESEELARIQAKGRVPKNDKWKQKYRVPKPLVTNDLPELASGWTWTNFEHLAQARANALKAGPFGSALKKSYYVSNGYKIYGQEQVLRGDAHYGDYYIDEERYRGLASCAVAPGDVLISLVGTIGQVLILPEDIEPGIINPRLVKLSLDGQLVESHFIKVLLQSPVIRDYFARTSHGGTMDILNLTILKELPIPLPPFKEQRFIVEEVERRLSVVDKLEATVEANLKQAGGLRQSILKRAFSGKLVPQDPDDEPAGVLLERIREERQATKQKAGKGRRGKTSSAKRGHAEQGGLF